MKYGCLRFREVTHVLALVQDTALCGKHSPASLDGDMRNPACKGMLLGASAECQWTS